MMHDAIETRSIDDCWNRIGTRGDGSCPQLAAHTRCLNCPVFARGAAALLDRPLSAADLADAARAAGATTSDGTPDAATNAASGDEPGMLSALVFRIAGEWLALPTATLRQIDEVRPIHSLPHRRNRVVLGLVNIRGTLTVAASLGELLRLERAQPGETSPRNGYARLIVAAHRGEPVAFPVDEVEGVLRFAASALLPVPAILAHAAGSHARGLVAWRGTTIGLLDPDRLFDALAGSLR
jgi:chemotaxis-related protein WspD